MLFSIFQWTYQNYNYMWSYSHWKQSENWQRGSSTTKAVKRYINSLIGKEEKQFHTPAGDIEEERDIMGLGILPGELVVQPTYWAHQKDELP